MIDGMTIRLKGPPSHRIFKMPCFSAWEYRGIAATGAEKYQDMRYQFDNGSDLYLKYYGNSQIIQIQCSLTKYHLGNNIENMRYDQLVEAVYSLTDWLQFHPRQTYSLLFEYGVATTLPYSPDMLLGNMMFANKKPYRFSENYFAQCNLVGTQFILKNYNKSAKENLLHDTNILRTEVQLHKGQPVHKMGINTLEDLLSKDNLIKLQNDHCKHIAATFIHDWRVDSTQMGRKELASYHNWSQRGFWQGLLGKPHAHKYQKQKAQAFYTEHIGISLPQQLSAQVNSEWETLIN